MNNRLSEKRMAISAGVTIVILSLAAAASLLAACPTSVITSSWEHTVRASIYKVWPQGWAFFTKDPESSSLVLYQADTQKITRADTLPDAEAKNLGGLSRSQRSQDTEKAIFSSRVKEWTDCKDTSNQRCLAGVLSSAPEQIDGVEPDPNFCGRYVLVKQTPVPFAFRNYSKDQVKFNSAAYVQVKCK